MYGRHRNFGTPFCLRDQIKVKVLIALFCLCDYIVSEIWLFLSRLIVRIDNLMTDLGFYTTDKNVDEDVFKSYKDYFQKIAARVTTKF